MIRRPLATAALLGLVGLGLVAGDRPAADAPPPLPCPAAIAAALAARGDLTLDVARDGGALPGPANAARTRRAIQHCVDALDPALGGRPSVDHWATLRFPEAAAGWHVDREVLVDQPKVDLVGAGPGAMVAMVAERHGATFVLGVSRRPMGKALSPDHLPDAFGKLDATAAPSPGARLGYATRGDSHLAMRGGPLDLGPAARGASALTVAWSAEQAGELLAVGPLMGLSEGAEARPWRCYVEDGILYGVPRLIAVELAVRDDAGATSARKVLFEAPRGAGVHHAAFQLDLKRGDARAYVDGRRVPLLAWTPRGPVAVAGFGPDYRPGPPLKLDDNQASPFLVGALGYRADTPWSDYVSAGPDRARTFYGIHVAVDAPFADSGIGTAQRFADGRPLDDARRYLRDDWGTVAYLDLRGDPAELAAGRVLDFREGLALGSRVASAFALSDEHSNPFAAFGGHRIRSLAIASNPAGPYGAAVAHGFVTLTQFTDCILDGGAVGLLGFGGNAYTIRLRDCIAGGSDAAIAEHGAMIDVDGLRLFRMGRACIRLHATRGRLRNVMIDPTGPAEYVVRATGGSDVHCEAWDVDIEGQPFPSIATFYAEATADVPLGARLSMRDVNCGTTPAGRPFVLLKSKARSNPARLDLAGLVLYPNGQSAVVEADAGWSGSVRLDHPMPGVPTLAGDSKIREDLDAGDGPEKGNPKGAGK